MDSFGGGERHSSKFLVEVSDVGILVEEDTAFFYLCIFLMFGILCFLANPRPARCG